MPAGAANGDTNTATVTATSVGRPVGHRHRRRSRRSRSRSTRCWSTTTPTRPDVAVRIYKTALTAAGVAVQHLGPRGGRRPAAELPERPQERRLVHRQQLPRPARCRTRASSRRSWTAAGTCSCPGQDILDQAAGTTPFVHDYLHITWDGTETQNDKATDSVHGVTGNPVTDGIGTVPLDHSVLGGDVRGPDHPERRRRCRRSPTTRARRTRCPTPIRRVQGRVPRPSRSRSTARRPQKADLMTRVFAFFGS